MSRINPLITSTLTFVSLCWTALTAQTNGFAVRSPCIDSLTVDLESSGDVWGGTDEAYGFGGAYGEFGLDECDPEEHALFDGDISEEYMDHKTTAGRLTYAATQREDGSLRTVLRYRSAVARSGWSHDFMVSGDSLVRRRLGWSGLGWRLSVGDQTDTALRIWPRTIPRRTLPAGWSAATGSTHAPAYFAAPLPQGVAAGVTGEGLSVWASQSWNPVTTGGEPPWHDEWWLRHAALGVRATPQTVPMKITVHASQTQIARRTSDLIKETGSEDALSEQMFATEISSLRRGAGLVMAWSQSQWPRTRGGLWGVDLRRRFETFTFDVTARQRSAGWYSAWDPATPAVSLEELSTMGFDDGMIDASSFLGGAGEVRASGRWTRGKAHQFEGEEQSTRPDRVLTMLWRAWNPRAGTARQGVRAGMGWTHDDFRIDLSATHRTSTAATGAVSLYRFARADARLPHFPQAHVATWRAWNAEGPTRTGIFVGAAPQWTFYAWEFGGPAPRLTLEPGLHLEVDAHYAMAVQASGGIDLHLGRAWRLKAEAHLPWTESGSVTWRVTVSLGS